MDKPGITHESMDRAVKSLENVIRSIRIMENDYNLKRHCSAESLVSLAILSVWADDAEKLVATVELDRGASSGLQ